MRLIDSFNSAEPERRVSLDLNQRAEQIVQDIVQHCHAYDPEVLSAAGAEADYVLAAIHCMPFCGVALQQPSMQRVRPEQLASRHHVLIQLDLAHPDHAALSEKFDLLGADVGFEDAVQHLLQTYMQMPMDEND
ncbi:hypothetical protein [Acinetobacter sp.]|uniref:hypothetical protein n=1 Tax=Acinetobacter sp. TaxID=472 RepID=UPI0035AFEC44